MHILCGKLCCSSNSYFLIGESEHYLDLILDSAKSGFRVGVVAESGDSGVCGWLQEDRPDYLTKFMFLELEVVWGLLLTLLLAGLFGMGLHGFGSLDFRGCVAV